MGKSYLGQEKRLVLVRQNRTRMKTNQGVNKAGAQGEWSWERGRQRMTRLRLKREGTELGLCRQEREATREEGGRRHL